MSDLNDDPLKALWRGQPAEVPAMPVAYVRHRVTELDKALRIRNALEQGACVVALVWCAVIFATASDIWLQIGVGLLLLGVAFSFVQWRRRVAVQRAQGSESACTGIVFYRRELERKRDMHRTLWRWYLLPMMPGAVVVLTWNFFGNPAMSGTPTPWIALAVTTIWTAIFLFYERAKAAQYQREIDALASFEKDTAS